MGKLYKKVLRNLLKDKGRAILSLLAILIGTMVFGIALFAHHIVPREIQETYAAMTPASAFVIVDRVDEDLIQLTEDFQSIDFFEVRASHQLRAQTDTNEWAPLHLFSAENFDDLQINRLEHEQGATNPHLGDVLIERSATGIANATYGDFLTVVFPDGSTRDLPITGVVGDITVRQQANLHRIVQAYVSHETLIDMELYLNRIDFVITENPYDREHILSVSDDYMALLAEHGYAVLGFSIANTPGINRHLDEFETGAFLLLSFSIVAFLFGSMIMGNLISTLIASETRQIGILKGIGAATKKITLAYLFVFFALIFFVAILSLAFSTLLAGWVAAVLLNIGNLRPSSTSVPFYLYAIYASLAVIVPLIMAYIPIRRGVNISVKDAINDYGIHADVRKSKLPEVKFLSRPVLLSMRNALRRKKRFLLNVAILAVAGVFFVATVTSMVLIQRVLSDNLDMWSFDYQVSTANVHTEAEISAVVADVPDVIGYEIWRFSSGTIVSEEDVLTQTYRITSPQDGSEMFNPRILSGRWLTDVDTNQIVLGHRLYNDEPGTKIGNTIQLEIGAETHSFEIVGIVEDFGIRSFFISEAGFNHYVPEAAANGSILFQLDTAVSARSVHNAINAALDAQGILVSQTQTRGNLQATVRVDYDITLQTLVLIIFMFVLVSGFGLTATMNAQVAERTKELGIMKAMGASKKQMIRVITSESIFLALVSWLVAALIGLPAVLVSLRLFGNMILDEPLAFNFLLVVAIYGLWLVFTLAIGYFSSRTCAKRVAKRPAKESLLME